MADRTKEDTPMRNLLIIALMVCLACMIGCRPRGVSPLDEEAQEEAARRAREELARQRAEEARQEAEAVKPIEPIEEEPVILESVYFAYDKYNLSDDAIRTLSANGAALVENPSITVRIEGHCDERGTDEYNLALGEKRALATRDFLVNFGIDKSRISIVSYGEERPVDPGHNEEAWKKNRRAAFVIR
jgi:peptidoglycan-associated lipoprotein